MLRLPKEIEQPAWFEEMVLAFFLLTVVSSGAWILYEAKTTLGIDLIPGIHLKDFGRWLDGR